MLPLLEWFQSHGPGIAFAGAAWCIGIGVSIAAVGGGCWAISYARHKAFELYVERREIQAKWVKEVSDRARPALKD